MIKKAFFAAGCFWCITPSFYDLGALKVTCGYSGGEEVNPVYADVKAQKTGHRESICIDYDDELLSYSQLLNTFINGIDPFDGEGQFIDRGHSYTTAIYYQNEEERQAAAAVIAALEEATGRKVCISLEPFRSFYDAEEYHQDYFRKEPVRFEQELIESGRKKAAESSSILSLVSE